MCVWPGYEAEKEMGVQGRDMETVFWVGTTESKGMTAGRAWRRLISESQCPEGNESFELSRVKIGPGVTYGGLLTVNHLLLQGPTGLKGDKGPPGPVGANVSATPSAGWGQGGGTLGYLGSEALSWLSPLFWESNRPGSRPALPGSHVTL